MTCVTNTTRRELLVVLVSNVAFFSPVLENPQGVITRFARQMIVLNQSDWGRYCVPKVFVSNYASPCSLSGLRAVEALRVLTYLIVVMFNYSTHDRIAICKQQGKQNANNEDDIRRH